MPKGLCIDKPQSVTLRDYEDPPLAENQLRIRTEFVSIKHGTEFHLFSGQSPFGGRYFDPVLRLFVEDDGTKRQAMAVGQFVGNMAVGVVSEVGASVTRFRVGDRVYCYGPICETQTKTEADVQPLTAPMTAEDAVCTDPAFYGYAALRDARVCLGDVVVVFGLGAIGLLLVQMLTRAGCLQVIAVDPLEKRRALAQSYGAGLTLDPAQGDAALEIRRQVGQGADIAVEASGHYGGLAEAIRSVRQCGRVLTLGYYKGKDSHLELGAEWHHNRLEMICSLPAWGNPLRDYPLWDEARLSRTITQFFLARSLTSQGIVDPVAPFADAAQAFLDVYHDPSQSIKLGIRF